MINGIITGELISVFTPAIIVIGITLLSGDFSASDKQAASWAFVVFSVCAGVGALIGSFI